MRRAVDGLGGLIDDYEFHYPQELDRDNLDDVRAALDGHGIYCIATGLHLDPRFGQRRPRLARRRDARAEALRRTREAARPRGSIGAQMICWPGVEGYNYPFQTPYAESGSGSSTGRRRPRRAAPGTACRSSSSTRTPSRR